MKVVIPDAVRNEAGEVKSRAKLGTLYFPGDRRNAHRVELPGKVSFPPLLSAPRVDKGLQLENALQFDNAEKREIFEVVVDNKGASYGEISRLAGLQGSRLTNNGRIKAIVKKYDLYHCNIGGNFGERKL